MASSLHARLLPKFANLEFSEVLSAVTPLRADFVRTTLMENERFHKRLFERVFEAQDIKVQDTLAYFPKEHLLQKLVQMKPNDIARGLGLAWYGKVLARACLTGSATSIPYARQELIDALHLRSNALTFPEKGLPDHKDILTQGMICLSVWLDDVPQEVQHLMRFWMRDAGAPWPQADDDTCENQDARRAITEGWCGLISKRMNAPENAMEEVS